LTLKRSSRDPDRRLSDAVAGERALIDQFAVVAHADQRPRVPGQDDHRQRAEDGVDGAALEAA
jgi:hypothetical protein